MMINPCVARPRALEQALHPLRTRLRPRAGLLPLIGITRGRMTFVVLEPVGVLVQLAANRAGVRLLDFHPQRARIRNQGLGVQDRVGAVRIREQLLGAVAVLEF